MAVTQDSVAIAPGTAVPGNPATVAALTALTRLLVVIGIALMLIPLLITAYMSLFADGVVTFPPSGYTLSWYGRLAAFPKFGPSLGTSLMLTTLSLTAVSGLLVQRRCRAQ